MLATSGLEIALNLPTGAAAPPAPQNRGPKGAYSDADLVGLILGGERWAEEALYRRHVHYVAGMVVRLLGNRTEAEDVVQDAFLLAFEKLRDLRDRSLVRAWLARIAVRLVQRRLEARKRRAILLPAVDADGDLCEDPLESLVTVEADQEMRAELERLSHTVVALPGKSRIAWTLHRVEGETLEDTAGLCGCSLATIKRRIAVGDRAVSARVGIVASA